jgi:hypothetical protein
LKKVLGNGREDEVVTNNAFDVLPITARQDRSTPNDKPTTEATTMKITREFFIVQQHSVVWLLPEIIVPERNLFLERLACSGFG